MIASQQGVCYLRADLPTSIDEAIFHTYKSGAKPEGFVDAAGVEEIKKMLFTTLEQLDTDQDSGIMTNYTPVITRYHIELSSIDEAIAFLPFHDGLHIGYIMSLRKLV